MIVAIRQHYRSSFFLASSTIFKPPVDPDIEDGRQRWPDKLEINWGRVAQAAHDAAISLIPDEMTGSDATANFELCFNTDDLPSTEQKIVKSFFHRGEAPMTDFGQNRLVNGRHRYFNCWSARPDLDLPALSSIATTVIDNQGEDCLSYAPQEAQAVLLNASEADLLKSPAFSAFLKEIASGNTVVHL